MTQTTFLSFRSMFNQDLSIVERCSKGQTSNAIDKSVVDDTK